MESLPSKIKDMLEQGKDHALLRCVVSGHDYRKVAGVDDEICSCCGIIFKEIEAELGERV